MLEYFLEKVRTINVITKDIKFYQKWEEQVFNKKGILVTITNNLRKSLKRAKIIINVDTDPKELMKYNLRRDAIIINLGNNNQIQLKGFEGIQIGNIEIELSEEIRQYFEENDISRSFSTTSLYESIFKENIKYEENVQKIKEDKIKLLNIIGRKGRITLEELKNSKLFC